MADLRTDYKDDVLNINTNERRKYRMIPNTDGTVSFEDVTDYVQQGDTFGAAEVNQITEKVNSCLIRADVVDNLESTATDLPLSANMGREFKNTLYKLDYENITHINFTAANQTYVVPEDGVITIDWRNAENKLATIGITSAKRGGNFIYLDSRYYTIPMYGWANDIIVEKDDVLTATLFANIFEGKAGLNHYPFKK